MVDDSFLIFFVMVNTNPWYSSMFNDENIEHGFSPVKPKYFKRSIKYDVNVCAD